MKSNITFQSKKTIGKEFLDLNRKLHPQEVGSGVGSFSGPQPVLYYAEPLLYAFNLYYIKVGKGTITCQILQNLI